MTESTKRHPIKLIAVDLDGTLLNTDHLLSERNEKAIKAALAQGVQVVLATGKTFFAASQLVKRLGIQGPSICVQGTAVYNADGSLRNQLTLDPGMARRAITFAEDRGYHVALYVGNRILVRQMHPRVAALTEPYHEPDAEAVGSLQAVLDNMAANKLIVVMPGDARRITALRWQLSMQINGTGRLLQAGVSDMLEILPPNASKGMMLKSLLKDMHIPASHVLACGDAENDVEMLELAGLGIAVGNASDHVKQVADVVVGTNDQDGVAEAIERFVLNAEEPVQAAESQPEAERSANPV